jgi:hypothetical protein
MFRLVLICAAFLVAAVASAQGPVFKVAKPGYYQIQGGRLVAVTIIDVDDPAPQPDPQPDPNPQPDNLSANAKEIKAAAEKATADPNREATAMQLAELYRQIAVKVTEKAIVGQEMIALATNFGTNQLLTGKGSAVVRAWQPTRDVFSSQWATALNKGGTDADYAKVLTDAAAGIQASAPNAEPQIDIAMIMAIIKMIMEILALFS